jgi:hypothetical protein
MIDTMFSADALKSLAAPYFECVPEQTVQPGAAWARMGKLPNGAIGEFTVETTFRYAGRTGGLDRIEVQQHLILQAPRGGARLPFAVKSAVVGAGMGERLFDSTRGRLAAADALQTFAGTVNVEVGGIASPVGVTQTQVLRIRTSDRPLLAPK